MTKLSGLVPARTKDAAASLVRRLGGAPSREVSGALAERVHKLHGVEIFPGVGTPLSRTTRYGATFVAAERGPVALTLIGWVNYTPIFFKPGTVCAVVGGRWWLVASRGLRYRGMLYGPFGEGKVRWNEDAKLAAASVRLDVSGGSGSLRKGWSAGNLSAVLNHLPFPPSPPRIGGTLTLERRGE